MTRRAVFLAMLLVVSCAAEHARAEDELQRSFRSPPDSAKAWCYWWWLNGAASKEGITRDFEEMRKQGIAGALLFDAGEAGAEAPRGPAFMSPEWRELYKHAVREADRCGIALGVNLCSGWNAADRGSRTSTRRRNWCPRKPASKGRDARRSPCRNRQSCRDSTGTSSCWRRPCQTMRWPGAN